MSILAGILAAAELQGDLHVIGEDVVKVLHPPVQGVPVRPVSDAVLEEPPAMADDPHGYLPLSSLGADTLI